MRISDWSSDVCSSDLPWEYTRSPGTGIRGTAKPGDAFYPWRRVFGDYRNAAPNGRTDKGCCMTIRTILVRSEEHTSELQSLMRISYAVFCLKKKKPQYPNK